MFFPVSDEPDCPRRLQPAPAKRNEKTNESINGKTYAYGTETTNCSLGLLVVILIVICKSSKRLNSYYYGF